MPKVINALTEDAEGTVPGRVEAAERTVESKNEVLASIAHELRTPIAAAMGNLDLALRALRMGEVDRVPRLLSTARDAMARLARLSEDLVAASQDQQSPLQLTPHSLFSILDQACAWATPLAQEKNVDLVWDIEGETARVLAHQDALLTVFGNILSNAIRYTPAGGRVTVRTWAEEDWVWVEVKDTGIGMSADTRRQIFDRFFRAPDARLTESQGLGLGLTLVKRMLDAHHGTIQVESAPGEGSSFRVGLPVLEASDEPRGQV